MADFKVTELSADLDFDQLPYWDVVIIGAGPGGLAASLTTAHRGLTTLVIEAKDKTGADSQSFYTPISGSSIFRVGLRELRDVNCRIGRINRPSTRWFNLGSMKSLWPLMIRSKLKMRMS